MDAKLIELRAKIEALLKDHDVGYHVVLHRWDPTQELQGQTELFYNFTPGYTNGVIQPIKSQGETVGFRIRSKREDYPSAEAQSAALAPAANFLDGMGRLLGQHAMALINLMEDVNEKAGIVHGDFVKTDKPRHGRGH